MITGAGLASPIGVTPGEAVVALKEGRHGIKAMPEWERFEDLRTRVAGVVTGVDLGRRWPRKRVRSMGRVAKLATYATEQAIAEGLGDDAPALLASGRTGIAYGSTTGSSAAFEKYATSLFRDWKVQGLNASLYLQFMAHTCAANLAAFFGVKGRVIPTCSTCTSASQAIGAGYEAIKYGLADVMLCGGAEEMHFSLAVTFDAMFATSAGFNDRPEATPRPFDRSRDGLVVGEGAGTLVLERLEHAQARGATILAELAGYGTNCDGLHVTAPSEPGMRGAMELSLADAELSPDDIDYVNAHGTATELGDIAETRATRAVFGRAVPFSSTKSYIGHTLGACGAIELVYCLGMMREGFLAPTRNLDEVDPRCGELDYVREPRPASPRVIMSNNFAFGGVNTSLIVRAFDG
ncbi:MAG: beta-ketoacyl-ACP synthase [Myxococcales bacterium]|nr:beta-ketoacyl-ACP synthase [Myxococcales bacterium]